MRTPTPNLPDLHGEADHHAPVLQISRRRILTSAAALTGAAFAGGVMSTLAQTITSRCD